MFLASILIDSVLDSSRQQQRQKTTSNTSGACSADLLFWNYSMLGRVAMDNLWELNITMKS